MRHSHRTQRGSEQITNKRTWQQLQERKKKLPQQQNTHVYTSLHAKKPHGIYIHVTPWQVNTHIYSSCLLKQIACCVANTHTHTYFFQVVRHLTHSGVHGVAGGDQVEQWQHLQLQRAHQLTQRERSRDVGTHLYNIQCRTEDMNNTRERERHRETVTVTQIRDQTALQAAYRALCKRKWSRDQ